MKIAVIATRFPYPTHTGDRLRLFHQIRTLSERHEIRLFALCEQAPDPDAVAEVEKYAQVEVIIHGRFRQVLSLTAEIFGTVFGFFGRALSESFQPSILRDHQERVDNSSANSRRRRRRARMPLQVALFRSHRLQERLYFLDKQGWADVYLAQLVRVAPAIETDVATCLDFVDALSLNFARRAEKANWFSSLFLKAEQRRLVRYESEQVQRFDATCVISAVDAEVLGEQTKVIPNGVDPIFFDTEPADYALRDIDIIFTGNLGYSPNIAAARILATEIVPELAELRSSPLRCAIVGARPTNSVLALEKDVPAGDGSGGGYSVEVVADVDDLRPWLRRSKVFVAPMTLGAGMQNKVVQAMAAGLCVVATPLANEGVNALDGTEIIEAEVQDFATELDRVLNDPDLVERVSAEARKCAQRRFSWETINKDLETLLEEIAQK